MHNMYSIFSLIHIYCHFTLLGHSPVCHWRAHNCYWLSFSSLCACSRPQTALPLQPAGLMQLPPTCPSQQREFIRGVGSKGWKGEIRGERRACLPFSWLSNNPLFSLWWMERQGPLSLLHAWKTGIWRQTEKYLSKALVRETPTHDFVCSFSSWYFFWWFSHYFAFSTNCFKAIESSVTLVQPPFFLLPYQCIFSHTNGPQFSGLREG